MSSELTPEIAAMLDKGFGPPASREDKAVPEPSAAAPETDTAPAPVTNEDAGVDASVILMREDYTRKAMELGSQRRALEAREREIAEYEALARRLDEDPVFRAQFEVAMSGQAQGQAPAAPAAPQVEARIRRLEQTIAEQRQQAHFDAVDQVAARVASEFQLSAKDTETVVQAAVRAGTLHPGVPNANLYDVLSMAAARHVLPRAASNGQRALLDQMKDKGRAATPTRETPAPPEPEPDVTKMSESAYQSYLISIAEKAGRGTS